MKIEEALTKIYADNAANGRLANAFYVYSLLSDMCHGSYVDSRLVKLYFTITSQINIFDKLTANGIDEGLKILKQSYAGFEGQIDFIDYKKCVFATVLAVKPDYNFTLKQGAVPPKNRQPAATSGAQSPTPQKAKRKAQKPKKTNEQIISETRAKLSKKLTDVYTKLYDGVAAIHFIRRRKISNLYYNGQYNLNRVASTLAEIQSAFDTCVNQMTRYV